MAKWVSGFALVGALSGCSKSEVRHQVAEGNGRTDSRSVESGESDSAERPQEPAAVVTRTLVQSAADCRETGGAACDSLLSRRREVGEVGSPLTLQAWVEALAEGCIKVPSQAVCDGALEVLFRWKSEGVDPAPVISMMERACEDGVAAGCVMAARRYSREGTDLEPHQHQGTRLFERGCNLGSRPACARAAAGYLHEAEFFADDARRVTAVELVRAACKEGDADACTVLAEASISPTIAEEQRNYAEARRLVKQACEAGWAKACNHYADLQLLGLGGDKDVAAGVATLGRSCDRGDADEATGYACAALAFLHAGRAELLPVDAEAARRFAKRACEVHTKRLGEPCTLEREVEELLGSAGR